MRSGIRVPTSPFSFLSLLILNVSSLVLKSPRPGEKCLFCSSRRAESAQIPTFYLFLHCVRYFESRPHLLPGVHNDASLVPKLLESHRHDLRASDPNVGVLFQAFSNLIAVKAERQSESVVGGVKRLASSLSSKTSQFSHFHGGEQSSSRKSAAPPSEEPTVQESQKVASPIWH